MSQVFSSCRVGRLEIPSATDSMRPMVVSMYVPSVVVLKSLLVPGMSRYDFSVMVPHAETESNRRGVRSTRANGRKSLEQHGARVNQEE